jgi:hypothetical protein
MIMKFRIGLALLLFISTCAFAQTNITRHQWNVTLKVVDESGNPIFAVNTSIGYFVNSQPASFDGLTDANGMFAASHSAISDFNELGFEASKSGFYTTRMAHMLFPPYSPSKWDIAQTLVLKKIAKPTAMYSKQINSLKFPEYNKNIGYDLMVGDWIAPYGKGINADMLFIEKHTGPQSGYILSVSFSNVGDGIQEFTLSDNEKKSDLRSAHEAPENGYQPTASQMHTTNPSRGFYFRIHTKLDETGNVVSAHYGKIYGDLAQFTYYYNPTPNDRSIEFDPKQNLLGGLKSTEQVTAP